MSDLSWSQFRLREMGVDPSETYQNFPMRVLVVANLHRYDDGLQEDMDTSAINICQENFDETIARVAPDLELNVENLLNPNEKLLSVSVRFSSIDDFLPAQLLKTIGVLNRAYSCYKSLCIAVDKLRNGDTDVVLDTNELEAVFGVTIQPDQLVDLLCAQAELATRICAQLNVIIHHDRFQQQERSWRSLRYLVNQLHSESNCSVDVIDATKEQLKESFDAAVNLFESPLYEMLHTMEYGQYGGMPYGAVVLGFDFSHHLPDVELLQDLAQVGAHCHAPVIANVSPRLFGLKSFRDLESMSSFNDLVQSTRYDHWRSLCARPESQYLALTLPRFVLREAYDVNLGKDFSLRFVEDVSDDSDHQLLGLAAYAFCACLQKSFDRHGLCVDIAGTDGGYIPGYDKTSPIKFPIEVTLSETREREISDAGMMPLNYEQGDGQLAFQTANSMRWGYITLERRFGTPISVSERLSAQLNYLFVVSRIAHILKMVQREDIGKYKSAAETEYELNQWLKKFVTDVDNPPEAVMFRRPLRKANVVVTESHADSHTYDMKLQITPHIKHRDESFTLSVDGHLGTGS